ncbi:hypothetical protein [Hymenobacter defluvii]|uniref:Uncharacterized protein n=1 Tax=Hymenobacter defluvii TaxID=2054411 RepID=A0ABS3TD13_9BACT|nr:hypothetical protein [Hymenobacter defluvii]MBO3271542.1 hypothetical protein [Hymenobacter defluvii]
MKKALLGSVYLFVGLCLYGQHAHAQFPTYAPPRMPAPAMPPMMYGNTGPSYSKGWYQLRDGSWHEGRILPDKEQITVKSLDKKDKSVTSYQAGEVVCYTLAGITGDTMRVASNFTIPRKEEYHANSFVRQVFRQGGYRLSEYIRPAAVGYGTAYQLLELPGQSIQVVPTKYKEFQEMMLRLFSDHPGLVMQLEAGRLGPDKMRDMLEAYARWKLTPPNVIFKAE